MRGFAKGVPSNWVDQSRRDRSAERAREQSAMSDPRSQSETQLRNIEQATGITLAEYASAVRDRSLDKHGQIVAFFKAEHGLTHGNANALAHFVRDELAGGRKSDDDLLAAQYAGPRAVLRPIYDQLVAIALSLGDDVVTVVQKTGVSFRRQKQFAVVTAVSSKRVQLGLNLDQTPDDDRIVETTGMCTHRVDLVNPGEIDDLLTSWIAAAYQRAGK